MSDPVCVHAVLVTFRRHDELSAYLDALAQQTVRLGRLVVVDNDPDPKGKAIVEAAEPGAAEVVYLAMPDNAGPAGAIAAGMAKVLETADDADWVVVLDDDDPPHRADTFEALRTGISAALASDRSVAAVALWGATVNRLTGRLHFTSDGTASLDYVPGNSLPHYRVGALRLTGLGTSSLFFGFDDLELGLMLRAGGFSLRSLGRAADHGFERESHAGSASVLVGPTHWRRYYSLRNIIWLYRRHSMIAAAVMVTIVAGIAKPSANLIIRPRLAWENLTLNVRAIRDGWTGRLGRTINPVTGELS